MDSASGATGITGEFLIIINFKVKVINFYVENSVMRISYLYKLRPTSSQITLMSEWFELLRRKYNYRLTEWFNWYERNRSLANACPLICHLPKLKDKPDFYSQKRDLVNSKILFPEYSAILTQVLQDCIERVKKAFDRLLKGDSSGKSLGRPQFNRFKEKGRYRSFTFTQAKQVCIQGNRINLPKIVGSIVRTMLILAKKCMKAFLGMDFGRERQLVSFQELKSLLRKAFHLTEALISIRGSIELDC
ncbi:MAG: helix-turn-helix domain-containing protein [Gloeobacterales cyanobacterium]